VANCRNLSPDSSHMPFGIFYIFRVQNSTLLPLDKGHFITGNGFIRSASVTFLLGYIEWENVG
ncbi:MAG: hypothetical protein PUK18_11095, partial [Firmicutes bacterium]|nr:hypothetical protein [Bacillota bacterium]MDY6161451.1 hypothetical protein [Candidatus Faecousia sp.]